MTLTLTLLLMTTFASALWVSRSRIGIHLNVITAAIPTSYILGMTLGSDLGFGFAIGVMMTELFICAAYPRGSQYAA